MFRFIGAWLQAVLRYIAAWLQAAAAGDDSDAPQAPMDFPVTASLGPLHRPLHSFRAANNNLPEGVSEGEVRRLEADLEELFTELKIVSEAEDPSFTARCWMKEVRELRYDAEDFFGEVRRSSAGAGRSALHTVLLWIPSKLKRRRQVAAAFSDLCARAKEASPRRQSFQLGPATIKPVFGQANVSHSPKFIGLEESMDKLVKMLAFDSEDAEQQVQVVPIFGSAGVGKTTLARAFCHNFGGKFQCQAFVRVSRNPDTRMLLSSILSQIKAPLVHAFPDVQDLIDDTKKYLQCKRYLIVIDDLWASSTWDVISRAFPDGDCCSRIIVTTEIEDVPLACSRYQLKYMYEMGPLNGDQSRKLFLGRVFGSEDGCPPDFKDVTYEISRKCGGLPLATENIASMLACELDIDQWKYVRDSLPSILSLGTNPGSEGLKEVLNIIYSNLSPKLKTCLLYLTMYPEGYTIIKDELVKQWVAEDFIGEGQDREKTARDYFDELVSRGMIQPLDRNCNDDVLTFTVHHMVLDLIRYKSLEENFIISVSCFQTTPGLPDKVRRLSVQFGGAKCANIPADFMMTQVRSLIFFGFLNCVPSFLDYKFLRVLILHIWADESKIFDLTRIGELFQLRYLKIDGNITAHLPHEIQQLKLLETLELHAPVNDMPDISCLPLLRTLSYFDLSKNSVENVQSLGELNNLQDLHLTWSNTAEPDNLKNNMQCLGSILWKLSNLKSLTLVRAASSHADLLDDAGGASAGISGDVLSSAPSPSALLQRLELSGRCCIFSSLPEWTKELGNLRILKISVRKLLRKDIDVLKGLPALMALSLYVWTAPVGKVVFDNEGFSVLKYFKLTCAAPCVAFLKGAMPSVRELKLAFNAHRMEQYSQIVAGLEYLIELREITAEVGGADESGKKYAESALRGAIANHPCTPVITVRRVQHLASHSSDPYVVDYYHLACMAKKGANSRQKTSFSPTSMKDLPSKSRSSGDQHAYIQVTEALAQAGLGSSNLIVGIDFTKSNEWTGKISYNRRCLHDIGNTPNPYEQVISIIGRTLSAFDDNNLVPCFGFGDASTHDNEVFSFYPENQPCKGFEEALERYREIVPTLRLAGPTSFAPIIETAIGIAGSTSGQYHVLLIIADGQITRSVDTQPGQLSTQERHTIDAIVKASHFPLSIVLVGVGDGPWDMMHKFEDNIPARSFNNFQFVNFTEIMSKSTAADRKEAEFALSALMKIPTQYKATLDLQLLGHRQGIPPRVPLPPPTKTAY